TIEAAQVDLYAAGQVKPTDVDLVQGKTTVVRFPEAAGTTILNIIDAHADNAQDLLFGGAAGTIATLVQDDENGIGAISETLSRIDQPLDGMSITAEGNVGSFWLGNTLITHESLQNYLGQLAQWSSAFKASADLLLYSCFTALGATGEALMASLAAETGLNVAASTNVTGSANHGGDWILESRTGSIETQTPFTDETLANWDGALATLTVDSNLDNTTANTVVTLREAIAAANVGGTTTDRGDISVTGADEIRFNGVTLVTLNAGQLVISEELTITGGGTNVTIERDASASDFRIFGVSANVPTTFEDVTISGGKIGGVGGGIRSSGDVTLINSTVSGNSSGSQGGGIFSNREVTLTNSTVSGNSAGGEGGGIISFATAVSLTNSTVSGNSSNSAGGGIASIGAVTLTNSSVSNNSANTDAGGILNFDVLTLTNSTVSGNSAGNIGGGMRSNADAILTNSTIANNSAGNHGGGIFGNGAVTLTNSTIAFNEAGGNSGGIYARNPSSLNNTIVSNNSAVGTGSDLSGTFTVNSSLILNPNGATIAGSNNIFGQDPLLQALA
ncbi:MAG: DUF4347 domain-containing protein, partial [Limnothrix sp. RL_2_0]|nr:DUF4347 domain-containing protein [Limnothrix sp. RL_2_0]